MSKQGKIKNGKNKAKHTKLLNQKKKRVASAKLKNKQRIKDIIIKSKVLTIDCPCGSLKKYKKCCYIAHNDIKNVSLPEQLMRSRYTAFTMGNIEYLMNSHHSSKRPINEKEAILKWAESVTWDKLEILNTTANTVEFKAYFYENGKHKHIYEKSEFVKEHGIWMYYDKH